MDTISLEHRLWIDSPRARIWQALTDPDQLLKWLTPSLISMGAQMQRDEHGRIRIVIGADSLDFAVVEGVEETRQLTMRSLPDRLITTTFTLNEENDGTLVIGQSHMETSRTKQIEQIGIVPASHLAFGSNPHLDRGILLEQVQCQMA